MGDMLGVVAPTACPAVPVVNRLGTVTPTASVRPYLCGPAAGAVRRAHGDVDAGGGLGVRGVAALGRRQPGDHQSAGETTLPEEEAERGRGGRHLGGNHRGRTCSSQVHWL